MEPHIFAPRLLTLEKLGKHLSKIKAAKCSLRVLPLVKCSDEEADKIRRDNHLPSTRSEEVYQVTDIVKSVQWQAPRSIPGLLFELGLEVGSTHLVTYGYLKETIACLVRVVEDEQKVEVIGHIHWSENALRALGLWGKSAKSVWRLTKGNVPDTLTIANITKQEVNFSKFTDRARKALGVARQAALDHKSSHINSGILLIGLAREGSGIAAIVLKSLLHVENPADIAEKIESIYKRCRCRSGVAPRVVQFSVPGAGVDKSIGRKIPFSGGGREALQLARQAATNLQVPYIGTEHMLLGIAKQEEGIGQQIITNLGLSSELIRHEVLSWLGLPDTTE